MSALQLLTSAFNMQYAAIIPDGVKDQALFITLQCDKFQNKLRYALSPVLCHPSKGSYHCNCEDGYDGNGFTSCNLMDECSTVTCGAYAHCEIIFDDTPGATNTINDAECVCDNGFEGDPNPYIRCIKVSHEIERSRLRNCIFRFVIKAIKQLGNLVKI